MAVVSPKYWSLSIRNFLYVFPSLYMLHSVGNSGHCKNEYVHFFLFVAIPPVSASLSNFARRRSAVRNAEWLWCWYQSWGALPVTTLLFDVLI